MRRMFSMLLCIGILALPLSGCTQEAKPDISEHGNSSSDVSASESVLRLPYSGKTIDPLTAESDLDQALTSLIYEQLCIRKSDFTTELCLAESVRASDCVLDVTLRDGISFHDGSALTAEDAVYSINRICADSDSPYYGLLADMVSVKITSTLSFQLVMDETITNEYSCLCFPVIKKGSGEKTDAIGTGAYAIETVNGKKLLKATSEELLFSKIELVYAKDVQSLRELFENGSVDSMALNLQTSEKITPICDYQTVNASTGIAHIIGFNCGSGIMKSADLRKAIGTCLPRKDICSDVMYGATVASDDWLCPGGSLELSCDTELTFEDAEAYLKALNTENPTEITLLYCNDYWVRTDEALYLKEFLEGYGFICNLSATDNEGFFKALQKKSYDICLMRTSLFSPCDLKDVCATDGDRNVFSYKNAVLDTVLQSYLVSDSDLQTEIGTEIENILGADMPFTVIGYEQTEVFIRSDSMFSFQPIPGCPYGDPTDWSRETEKT